MVVNSEASSRRQMHSTDHGNARTPATIPAPLSDPSERRIDRMSLVGEWKWRKGGEENDIAVWYNMEKWRMRKVDLSSSKCCRQLLSIGLNISSVGSPLDPARWNASRTLCCYEDDMSNKVTSRGRLVSFFSFLFLVAETEKRWGRRATQLERRRHRLWTTCEEDCHAAAFGWSLGARAFFRGAGGRRAGAIGCCCDGARAIHAPLSATITTS